jgi:ABC-2 type transport system permease protein
MRKYFRIYACFIKNSFSYETQQRADTLIKLLVNFLWIGLLFLTIQIFFTYTTGFNGWTKEQVYLMTTFFILADELFIFLFRENFYTFSSMIVEGELDVHLTKPVNTLFLITTRRLLFRAFYRFLIQIIILFWLGWHFNFAANPFLIFATAIMMVMGVLINYSFSTIINTFSFWLARIENVNEALGVFGSIGRYPIDVFPRIMRTLTLTILPIAFSAYVPVATLVGRWPVLAMLYTVLFGILLFMIALVFWNFAVKRYSSASS